MSCPKISGPTTGHSAIPLSRMGSKAARGGWPTSWGVPARPMNVANPAPNRVSANPDTI